VPHAALKDGVADVEGGRDRERESQRRTFRRNVAQGDLVEPACRIQRV